MVLGDVHEPHCFPYRNLTLEEALVTGDGHVKPSEFLSHYDHIDISRANRIVRERYPEITDEAPRSGRYNPYIAVPQERMGLFFSGNTQELYEAYGFGDGAAEMLLESENSSGTRARFLRTRYDISEVELFHLFFYTMRSLRRLEQIDDAQVSAETLSEQHVYVPVPLQNESGSYTLQNLLTVYIAMGHDILATAQTVTRQSRSIESVVNTHYMEAVAQVTNDAAEDNGQEPNQQGSVECLQFTEPITSLDPSRAATFIGDVIEEDELYSSLVQDYTLKEILFAHLTVALEITGSQREMQRRKIRARAALVRGLEEYRGMEIDNRDELERRVRAMHSVIRRELPSLREQYCGGRTEMRGDVPTYNEVEEYFILKTLVVNRGNLSAAGRDLDLAHNSVKGKLVKYGGQLELINPPKQGTFRTVEQVERSYVGLALQNTGGNIKEAGKRIGVSQRGMHKKLKRLGIDRNDYTGYAPNDEEMDPLKEVIDRHIKTVLDFFEGNFNRAAPVLGYTRTGLSRKVRGYVPAYKRRDSSS